MLPHRLRAVKGFARAALLPRNQKILALKSSVHFRANFRPIPEENLVAAPDANPVDNREAPDGS